MNYCLLLDQTVPRGMSIHFDLMNHSLKQQNNSTLFFEGVYRSQKHYKIQTIIIPLKAGGKGHHLYFLSYQVEIVYVQFPTMSLWKTISSKEDFKWEFLFIPLGDKSDRESFWTFALRLPMVEKLPNSLSVVCKTDERQTLGNKMNPNNHASLVQGSGTVRYVMLERRRPRVQKVRLNAA